MEWLQDKRERDLISTIRDRKSRVIVENSIKSYRENMLTNLSQKKNVKLFPDLTFNSFIPLKTISLSLTLNLKNNKKNCRKYISETNIRLTHLNPNLKDKDKIKEYNLYEEPYINDDNYDKIKISDDEEEENNEYDDLEKMVSDVNDEILFYDEKLQKRESINTINNWNEQLNRNDILTDFIELKQKVKKSTIKTSNDLLYILQQENVFKQEISRNSVLYEEISKIDHFQEFMGYLSEKTYKFYMKKMNYSYLVLMLLSYFNMEKFINSHKCLTEDELIILFIKKVLLFTGIVTNKIYDSIMSIVKSLKGQKSFENYLNIFWPIIDLSDKYQCYKYKFLLFLVKKYNENIITLNDYKLFCDSIKGKSIYDPNICDDIIGKVIPIIKAKYPLDALDQLNYTHVSITLEFLLHYKYDSV